MKEQVMGGNRHRDLPWATTNERVMKSLTPGSQGIFKGGAHYICIVK